MTGKCPNTNLLFLYSDYGLNTKHSFLHFYHLNTRPALYSDCDYVIFSLLEGFHFTKSRRQEPKPVIKPSTTTSTATTATTTTTAKTTTTSFHRQFYANNILCRNTICNSESFININTRGA